MTAGPAPGAMRKALPLVVALTLIWGTNWPLFPLAVREVSVWTFRAVSSVGAGLALLMLARLRGERMTIAREHWPTIAAASFAYLVVWNVASTYAAVLIPSGQAAILGFTMPLWAALISWAVLGQRPTGRILLALAAGAAGVGLLLYDGLGAFARAPLGFALGLLAGIGWASGTVVLKQRPVAATPLVLTGWQLLVSSIPTIAGALWFGSGEAFVPSAQSLIVIAYITLVPMALGNAAWFSIVKLLPANVAGLSAVMVPVVAMISGAIIHREPLGLIQWTAMACCGAGLALALVQPARES